METTNFGAGVLSVEQWHCDFYIRLSGGRYYYYLWQKFCLWSMLLGNGTDFSGDGCDSRRSTSEGTQNFTR